MLKTLKFVESLRFSIFSMLLLYGTYKSTHLVDFDFDKQYTLYLSYIQAIVWLVKTGKKWFSKHLSFTS